MKSFMSIDIDKLAKVNWQRLVSRPSALLFSSICADAFKSFKDVTGIAWHVEHRLVFPDGQLLHAKKDLDELFKIFTRGGIEGLDNFLRQMVWHIESFEKLALRLEKNDYSKASDKDLKFYLEKFKDGAYRAHNFMTPIPIIDEALTRLFLRLAPSGNEEDQRAWWRTITYSGKDNEARREAREFYSLAKAYISKSSRYNEFLSEHLSKHAWIGARNYRWDREWTKNDLEKRLLIFFALEISPAKKLKELDKNKEQAIAARRKLLRKLKISNNRQLQKLTLLAREYAYRRTWRTDVIYRSGYRSKRLFYEIARRAKLKENLIPYLTVAEVDYIAKNSQQPPNIKDIKKRKDFYVHVICSGKEAVLSGKSWKRKFESIAVSRVSQINISNFTGQATCPGLVKGKAKIVKSVRDLNKVERGDILVAEMTFPYFISGMERAAAFVTDEGGILSHVAIVSRELGKPCITGTGIATKALRDGDFIEVDARRGKIKILKRLK